MSEDARQRNATRTGLAYGGYDTIVNVLLVQHRNRNEQQVLHILSWEQLAHESSKLCFKVNVNKDQAKNIEMREAWFP